MDRKTIKDSLITGFAVFAIFFGAGNLIFPAAVGLSAGDQWPAAMLAMILCGVVLPFLALVAVANTGNSWSDLCKPVGTWYDKGVFFVATVGMVILSNLPRTAATTHEVAIAPLFPSCPVWVTSVIFFALVLFFAFDENNIIDRIGKYITPLMLVFLIIIVGKGLITPLGTPEPTGQEHVFKSAFVELYYTGDLFSGLFVSTIFLTDLARKGYETQEERKKMTVKAVWVAGIASVIVQALEIAETMVRSGAMDIIVIDSVAALVPKQEIEGDMGDSHVGLQARLMSQALRKLTPVISKSNCVVIFINQLREKVGVMFGNPETTTGGRALKFYASVRMDVRRIETLKQNGEMVGNRTRIKIVKNKIAPPFKEAEFDIMFGKGISKEGDILDLATKLDLVNKSGAWYAYNGDKIGQGRENAKIYLGQHPEIMEELEEKIRAHYHLDGSVEKEEEE